METCTPWKENTTQQIDLAFNIFFMVYFFVRVSAQLLFLVSSYFIFVPVHSSIRQVLVHARASLFRRLLYDSTVDCLNIPGPYMDRWSLFMIIWKSSLYTGLSLLWVCLIRMPHTGLGFLRALRLMSVPDILQYLNILKTSTSIREAIPSQLCSF